MSPYYVNSPEFHRSQNVISIVDHPPEIQPGTLATIVCPWFGTLCAIQLPNGEIHRWFASLELEPTYQLYGHGGPLVPGSYATIISNIGHGDPPHIQVGTVARIVKCIPHIIFYDLMINNTEYHRWLAEFEIATPLR